MQLNQYRVSSGLKYFNIYIQSITVFPEGYDRISFKPNIACRGYIFKSGYEMIKAGHITRVVSKLSRVGNVSVTDQILRPMLSPTTSTTSTWNYTFLVFTTTILWRISKDKVILSIRDLRLLRDTFDKIKNVLMHIAALTF